MEAEEATAVGQLRAARGRHVKKRALKNKALSVAFNEKDLKDFVTGFHKRKKKRRKEARQKQEAADRRKRIGERKRRKMELEYAIHGGAPPDSGAQSVDGNPEQEDEESEPVPSVSVSGTTMYDNGDIKVTVITSDLSREEVDHPSNKSDAGAAKKHSIPVSRKASASAFKKFGRQRPRPRHRKREGKNNKKRR